jgi:hypothetical protein
MKLLIQIIFLLFSLATFGQTKKYTTIKLATGDCRKTEAYSWHGADTVLFYKLPEDTLLLKIIPRQYRQFPIKLENIPVSDYRLSYKNNFNQIVVRQISLTDQGINSIILCPDTLLEYPQNTLQKLQDKDSIIIAFYSQGCFHTDKLRLVITKEDKYFVANLYNILWTYETKKGKSKVKFKGRKLLNSTKLTDLNIIDFKKFENELNFAEDGGCTTTDMYVIESKYLNIKKTDGSCTWDGFFYLRKSFFGEKE